MNKTRKRVKTTFATFFLNSLVKNNVRRVFGLPGGPMDYPNGLGNYATLVLPKAYFVNIRVRDINVTLQDEMSFGDNAQGRANGRNYYLYECVNFFLMRS